VLTERERDVLVLVARSRAQAVVKAYETGLVRPGDAR
jgi:DNA-binding CsgD family transcriptional regulator